MQLQQMRWVRIATLLLLAVGIALLCLSLVQREEPPSPPAIDIKVVDESQAEAARLQAEADRLAWETRVVELQATRKRRILLFSGIAVSALLGFVFTFTVKQKQDIQVPRQTPLPPR